MKATEKISEQEGIIADLKKLSVKIQKQKINLKMNQTHMKRIKLN